MKMYAVLEWLQKKKPADEQVLDALRRMYGETCQHEDWVVRGWNSIGCGTCTLCDQELPFDLLVLRWKARIERETGVRINV